MYYFLKTTSVFSNVNRKCYGFPLNIWLFIGWIRRPNLLFCSETFWRTVHLILYCIMVFIIVFSDERITLRVQWCRQFNHFEVRVTLHDFDTAHYYIQCHYNSCQLTMVCVTPKPHFTQAITLTKSNTYLTIKCIYMGPCFSPAKRSLTIDEKIKN